MRQFPNQVVSDAEKLSYDYGYEFDEDDYGDHICKCGSKKCIGFIIASEDWPKYKKFLRLTFIISLKFIFLIRFEDIPEP